MGFLDRGVRRAFRHLDDEVVVASLVGREGDGRRRRFVVVTERRVLVGSPRGERPVDLGLDGVTARFERPGRLLTLRQGDVEIVLRDVEEVAARALVEVITMRRRSEPGQGTSGRGVVRIVADPHGHGAA